jgi:hypothetical protein
MKLARPLLLFAAALLVVCNLNVDPQFRVKDFRILAVRSRILPALDGNPTLADVSPGDTVTLDALVANPLARPDLTVDWFACPPVASDAVTPCADLQTLQDPTRLFSLASGPSPSVVALGFDTTTVTTTIPALSAALGFVIGTAVRQPTYACRMYAEIVVVVVASAGGRHQVAVKTIRVKPPAAAITAAGVPDQYVLNHNPVVGDLFRAPADADNCTGGISISSAPFPAGRTTICGTAPASSVEVYNVCDPGIVTSTEESLAWQWYVTDGDFPKVGGAGNATGENVDFVRPPGAFTLWAILRDGRGGDDWVTLLVSAAKP